jgi:hypothetical protein
MLLPQSSAFETLRSRLDSVASVPALQRLHSGTAAPTPDVNFGDLLAHFRTIRTKHQQNLVKRTSPFSFNPS